MHLHTDLSLWVQRRKVWNLQRDGQILYLHQSSCNQNNLASFVLRVMWYMKLELTRVHSGTDRVRWHLSSDINFDARINGSHFRVLGNNTCMVGVSAGSHFWKQMYAVIDSVLFSFVFVDCSLKTYQWADCYARSHTTALYRSKNY